MVVFNADQFDEAQAHEPQIGRWTVGNKIYVLENEDDRADLPKEVPQDAIRE